MEDFQAAFQERHADVEALHAAQRCTAAMHFGGVAVECLLKAIVIPHLANLALANTYPVEELLPYYAPIADIIDEDA